LAELVLTLRVDTDQGTAEIVDWGDQYSDQMERAEKSTGRVADATAKMARTAGVALTAVGAAVAMIGKKSMDAAVEFESSFAGVRKTVTATDAEFADLAQGFRDMAKEIPVSVNELNRIGEAAGQLGISTGGILQFTRTMADLGVTTNMASDEAATALARFSNIVGTSEADIGNLGATIVALGNNLATTESEIVEMGLRLAGAGKQVDLTEAQILALGGALSSVGVAAQAGGTAFSRVLSEMADSVFSGGEALENFAAIAGVTGEEFVQVFEQDASQALLLFVDGLARVKEEGGNVFEALRSVSLGGIRVRDALLRSAGANDKLRDSLRLSAEAWAAGTALTDEAAERYKTTASQIQIMQNRIHDMWIELGGALLPVLQQVVGMMSGSIIPAIESLVHWFTNLPKPVQTTAIAFTALATAMALVVGPLLILSPNILSLYRTFQLLAGAKGISTAATLLSATGTSTAGLVGKFALLKASISGLAGRVLPAFLTKTVQGRDAMGKFTTGVKAFNAEFFTSPRSFTAGIKAIPGLLKSFASTMTGVVVAGFAAMKTAAIAAWAVIAAHPLIALLAVLGAVTLWVTREGGMVNTWFEELGAKGAASFKELRGEWEAAGDTLNALTVQTGAVATESSKMVDAIGDAWREANIESSFALDIMKESIAAGDSWSQTLVKLEEAASENTEEGRLLAGVMTGVEAAMEAVATTTDDAGDALTDAEADAKKLTEAMEALGMTTEKDAIAKLEAMTTVLQSGTVPHSELAEEVLKLRDEYADLAARSPGVATALTTLTGAIDAQALKAAELAAVFEALGLVGLDTFKEKVANLDTAIQEGLASPGQLAEVLRALKEEADQLDFSGVETGLDAAELAFQTLIMGAEGISAAMPAAIDQTALFGEIMENLPEALPLDPFERFADILDRLGVQTVPDAVEALEGIPEAIEAGIIPTEQLDEVVQKLDEEYGELAETSPDVRAALDEITEAAREQGAELEKDKGVVEKFFGTLMDGIKGLGDSENLAGFLGAGLGSILSGDVMGGIGDIAGQIGGSLGGAVGAAFGPIGSMIGSQLGKLAGKIPGMLHGLFTTPEWEKVAKDVGAQFGKDVSEELAKAIAETAEEFGNRAAAITKHLPDIIAEQGVDSAAALGTFVDASGDFLAQLDAGVFTSAEAFAGLGETLGLLIPEMDKVGASTENTRKIFGTLTEALNRVATGAATAAEGEKLLADTVPLLIERLDEMGAAGVMGMRSIIEQTRALGMEVEALTEFVLEQTRKITDGVSQMTDTLVKRLDRIEGELPPGLGIPAALAEAMDSVEHEGSAIFAEIVAQAEDAVPEMEDAGEDLAEALIEPIRQVTPEMARALVDIKNQALFAAGAVATAFSEMLAQGIPVTQIVEEIGPKLLDLKDVFARLGVEAPEAFQKISAFARKLAKEDVALVIEGVQGMGQAMEGLRDLGMATQTDFDAFATSLGSAFDQLRDQGLTQSQAFAALGPQLQTMADLARDFGFEVDSTTAALLEEASAQGVVKGATLDMADAVSAGFEGMFQRFDAMLAAQGVATEGMFHFGDQATSAMDRVSGSTTTTSTEFASSWSAATTSASASVSAWQGSSSESFDQFGQAAKEAAQGSAESFAEMSTEMVVDFDQATGEMILGMDTAAMASDTTAEHMKLAFGIASEEIQAQYVEMSSGVDTSMEELEKGASETMKAIAAEAETTGRAIEDALDREFNVRVNFEDGGGGGDDGGRDEPPAFQAAPGLGRFVPGPSSRAVDVSAHGGEFIGRLPAGMRRIGGGGGQVDVGGVTIFVQIPDGTSPRRTAEMVRIEFETVLRDEMERRGIIREG
jgi:TP901 family phage tail tape measure protein